MSAPYRLVVGMVMRALGMRAFRFRVGETDLKVWRGGAADGDPWLLLHGLGASGLSWGPLLKRLAEGRRLLVPELSGLGGSRVPGRTLAVADGVPALAELLARESAGRPATVAGNSLGGWIALRLALAHPDLVSRLVLVSPGGYREQDWNRIERLVRVSDMAGTEQLLEKMFVRPPVPIWLLRYGFRRTFASDGVAAALDKLTEADALSDDDLARIAAPTALVWGEHDGIFEVECAAHMAAALPHPRVYRLHAAAHIPHWEKPEAVMEAIDDFCRRTAPADGEREKGGPDARP